MTTLAGIVAVLAGLTLATLLLTRTVLSLSLNDNCRLASLTILGVGMRYDLDRGRIGFGIGRLVRYFPRRSTPKHSPEPHRASHPRKMKPRRKTPLSVYLRIGVAMARFAVGLLARLRFETKSLVLQPAIPNPALAGMAYGWGQALYGMFPGWRDRVDFAPRFDGESSYSGEIMISIKNRQVAVLLFRLLRDLPKKDIFTYMLFKRGG
jgi:hypothetical protein